MKQSPELIVLSHLRWTWVWQRPQHLISRLAMDHDTWFVEEPRHADVESPVLRVEQHGSLSRVWLDVPERWPEGFSTLAIDAYLEALPRLLGGAEERRVWLYTPMALPIARGLRPSLLVFDVMDDLSSFRHADSALPLRHRQALREADVVFTGGRSLQASVKEQRPEHTHLFASGVEPEHYRSGKAQRTRGGCVAGYVGVIDERIDLDLVAGIARLLPDWEIQLVGPVAKIDPSTLPAAPNIRYLGQQPYERLPDVMASMDVALMPFAHNEATRSISPTKTLEYLAAGLPVVSTRIPDVVADYAHVVTLADDAVHFAEAIRHARLGGVSARDAHVQALLERHHWDSIAARMLDIVEQRSTHLERSREETA